MISKLSKPAARLALGVAFLLTPPLLYSAGILAIPSAHAAKGGNGNGNAGGNGNGNGNGRMLVKTAAPVQRVKSRVPPKPKKLQRLK